MTAEPGVDGCYSVEFALNVIGAGLVIHACVPEPSTFGLYVGERIAFVRPDGSVLPTVVRGIRGIHDGHQGRAGLIGFTVANDVQRDDIPQGTLLRVWRS